MSSNTAAKQNQDLNPSVCDFSDSEMVKKWSYQVREEREFHSPLPPQRLERVQKLSEKMMVGVRGLGLKLGFE